MNKEFVLAPLKITLTDEFLCGCDDHLCHYESVIDRNLAIKMAFSQNISEGFYIWQDIIDNAVVELFNDDMFGEAEAFLSDCEDLFSEKEHRLNIANRKNKISGNDDDLAGFIDEVAGDVFQWLKLVSISRYILGDSSGVLDEIYDACEKGLFPCGKRSTGELVVFNPALMK